MRKILLGASSALIALTSIGINAVEKEPQAIAHHTREHGVQQRVAQNTMTRLRIAFPSRRDSTDLQNKANQVAQFLSGELKMPVEAIVSDETAAVEALRANRVDVAFLSSRPAIRAEQATGARMVLAEVRSDYSGGNTYDSILVVRKDSPLRTLGNPQQTLNQLRGRRMAFASRTSGSGFIIPTGDLVGRGIVQGPDRLDSFFSQVTYGDGYSSALQAVLRRQADVGAVSEYALNPPWITQAEAAQLRVLYSIPGVPAHGIVIDDDVPAPMRDRIVNALMKLNQPANNGMFRALYNSTELRRVDHARHLAPMRQALQRARLEP
ncbi:MAG TPA: phosphonate ABC transporter substrate-binding protein [Cyanobacteria bacterium UBA11369]|nr:phosphonate ABC transporter substrate-binding protein [Cyanobacteria bacterium UBA11371]HBE35976.1 phosphonate ABC transporter substrate-binding protein [Cyanobacteria bacterium UBA11368]HBE49659.1 phosphonate ABC transporter substrate-binding protein [Cyanobacteria bacterium UBA11369]